MQTHRSREGSGEGRRHPGCTPPYTWPRGRVAPLRRAIALLPRRRPAARPGRPLGAPALARAGASTRAAGGPCTAASTRAAGRPAAAARTRAAGALCALLLALAGCGGGQPLGRPAATAPPSAAARASCPPLLPGAAATVLERAPDVVVCAYRRPAGGGGATGAAGGGGSRAGVRARVTLDDAPQAAFRFDRAVVERSQAHLGGAAGELPQQVAGVGRSAAWIPAASELLATDDRRLVTVDVAAPAAPAAARATALALARAALR